MEHTEQQFHALRRLVASKAGFAGFTTVPGFREKVGQVVARALRLNNDNISHAAIDMLCALMEPMHEDYDLRQEQLNKSSLMSSEKFLDGLLDLWSSHVVRKYNFRKWLNRYCVISQSQRIESATIFDSVFRSLTDFKVESESRQPARQCERESLKNYVKQQTRGYLAGATEMTRNPNGVVSVP